VEFPPCGESCPTGKFLGENILLERRVAGRRGTSKERGDHPSRGGDDSLGEGRKKFNPTEGEKGVVLSRDRKKL